MLAFLNTPAFPVFSPPTYFNPAFILRFYLSFIFYLLCFFLLIYHVMRTDTCNKPHTLRDAVTGRNRHQHTNTPRKIYILTQLYINNHKTLIYSSARAPQHHTIKMAESGGSCASISSVESRSCFVQTHEINMW